MQLHDQRGCRVIVYKVQEVNGDVTGPSAAQNICLLLHEIVHLPGALLSSLLLC